MRASPAPSPFARRAAAASGFSSSLLGAPGDQPHRRVDQRDLRREQVAEQAGNAPSDIDARASHGGGRQHLDAGDACACRVPDRPAAHQREALGDLLAAGPQRGAAPQIDDEGARHLAMRLEIEADHIVGGEPAELHRGRRRQHARIGGVEIAAGWQHVAPAALRRAGGAGLHALAVERGKQSGALRRGAGLPGWIDCLSVRHAPKHMQPVLDGDVLQVAEPGIDLAQRLVGVVALDAGLAGETRASRGLDDQPRQTLAPPPVEPVGDGVFVDQPLELLRRARRARHSPAAAADGRWSWRRCAAWPAPPRPDC